MNRQERRKANKGKPKAMRQQDATVRSEVYSLTGKDGSELHLDVVSMRQWAEQHAERVSVPVETPYIERLLARGAVTEERVMDHTLRQDSIKPLLVCRDINADGDEIVDGNHTYVALGLAWAMAHKQGMLPPGFQPRANAFMLEPDQWRQFIIPPAMFAVKPT